ncbi:unnamed protein product [Trifolium pratense]|uniref:Uncharacterized protein n=2 Tax=Trifolium pratense TaxID=57577 RepID=A0ACB0I767_TRIPR|nr:unnamed protein product [Trifolium pratense]
MNTFAQELSREESVKPGCWIDEEIQQSLDKPRRDMDWPKDFKAIDMKQRFIGHRNAYLNDNFGHPDVGFLGQQGEYVISGSADGMVYIWEKISGRLVRTLKKNKSKLGKCLHSHPFVSAVAVSFDGEHGVHEVEIWAPNAEGVETNVDADFKAMGANQNIDKD